MQAGALTAAVGRQTIDSMVGRAAKGDGGGRNFTAREARTASAPSAVAAAGASASAKITSSGAGGGGQDLKFMRFTLSFDVQSAELFILVRDPSSGKIVFKAPNVARPSPIDEMADKQEAELKEAMAGDGGEGQSNAAPTSDAGSVLAAAASNNNAPSDAASSTASRASAGGGDASARGQGVNVTA